MRISEITAQDVAAYLRLEEGQWEEAQMTAIMRAARQYIASHTGIPEDAEGESLDTYEDLSLVYLVLCQDLHDNRTMYPDIKYASSANRVVEGILAVHARNLI